MRNALKRVDKIINRIIFLLLLLILCGCVYIVWDNQQVYKDAETLQSDLIDKKPVVDPDTGEIDFSALREINPDVCAWLTVDGTNIDYPVVQGKNNYTYMNRDVYKKTSLAGSIFLDSRNDNNFCDAYSIIYGHHMENHQMFGDLDEYKDKDFFDKNHTATLMTIHGEMKFQILSVMEVQDSVQQIFNPSMWDGDLSDLVVFIKDNSIHIYNTAMDQFEGEPNEVQLLVLITCASGHTGTRTVVVMTTPRKHIEDKPDDDNPDKPDKPDNPYQTGDSILNAPALWITVIALATAAILGLIAALIFTRKKE